MITQEQHEDSPEPSKIGNTIHDIINKTYLNISRTIHHHKTSQHKATPPPSPQFQLWFNAASLSTTNTWSYDLISTSFSTQPHQQCEWHSGFQVDIVRRSLFGQVVDKSKHAYNQHAANGAAKRTTKVCNAYWNQASPLCPIGVLVWLRVTGRT